MKKPVNLHIVSALREVYVGEGVKLCPLDQSHATAILKILEADNSIRDKVTAASRLYTPEDVASEIERYRKDIGLIRYALIKDEIPIGLVSLWRDDGFWGTKNLNDYGFGYFLDPNERGKGLVTRAVQSLMHVLAKNIYVNQFVAFCEDKNDESISVLTKLGFRATEETLREPTKGWIERKYTKPTDVK